MGLASTASPADVAALTAIATTARPAADAPPVSTVLAEVFHLCRHSWVYNFLFTTDMSPLSALTSPFNMRAAISSSMRFANVDPSSHSPIDSPFNVQLSGDSVFVPAFSVASIGVGFGIWQCKLLSGDAFGLGFGTKVSPSLENFRFAHDDSSGVFVLVEDDPRTGLIKIDYVKNITTTSRRRAFVCLSRSHFHAAFRASRAAHDSGITAPTQKVPTPPVSSVVVCESSTESRRCPICNASPNSWCACVLENKPSRHPFDFSALQRSLTAHTGIFEGAVDAHYCPSRPNAISATLGARIEITGSHDAALIARFSKWAITDNLQRLKVDPVAQILPAAPNALIGELDVEDDTDSTGDDAGNGCCGRKRQKCCEVPECDTSLDRMDDVENDFLSNPLTGSPQAAAAIPSASADLSPSTPLISDTPGSVLNGALTTPKVSFDGAALSPSLDVTAILQEAFEANATASIPNVNCAPSSATPPSTAAVSMAALSTTETPSPKNPSSPLHDDESVGDEHDVGDVDDDVDQQDDGTAMIAADACTAFQQEFERSCTQVEPILGSSRSSTKLQNTQPKPVAAAPVPLAPTPSPPSQPIESVFAVAQAQLLQQTDADGGTLQRSGSPSTEVIGEVGGEKERERRVQLRRQRNREAAQRSNMRRKIRNDTLKKNLKESQSRAAELRARELLLREENLKLRKLLP